VKSEQYTPVDAGPILQTVLGRSDRNFGLSAVVLQGDRIIASGVAGVRRRGGPERITLDDQFHLGSCTKAMTATLVAMLIEEGRLNWTSTLGEILTDTVKDMHPAWQRVTLKHVLAHRAGLRRDPERSLSQRLVCGKTALPRQRREIAGDALSRPPKYHPGSKAAYSNLGYIIAGSVLENLTGRAWEDLMSERLFQPLGVTTGGFGPPGSAGQANQPWGHSWFLGKPLDPGNPSAELPRFYGPAGLVHMSVPDWAKFISLHLRGDPANPHRQTVLLRPETFAEMHPVTPPKTYSAGWVVSPAAWAKGTRSGDTGRRLWHGGSNGRWNCVVGMAPEIESAVLVACNRGLDIALWKTHQATKALIRAFAKC